MYPRYKSKSGYYIDDDDIDSYGVDHKNFSTREELEYQMARQEQENELENQNNQQGNNGYLISKEMNTNSNWGAKTAKKIDEYMQNYNLPYFLAHLSASMTTSGVVSERAAKIPPVWK